MTNLSELKLADLRAINALLKISNRKSIADNVAQITNHLKKNYHFEEPLTKEAITTFMATATPVTQDVSGPDMNVNIDQNKLVEDLVRNGLVDTNQLGNPDNNINQLVESLYTKGAVNIANYQRDSDEDSDDDDEEEENPDPAVRYRLEEEEEMNEDMEEEVIEYENDNIEEDAEENTEDEEEEEEE